MVTGILGGGETISSHTTAMQKENNQHIGNPSPCRFMFDIFGDISFHFCLRKFAFPRFQNIILKI